MRIQDWIDGKLSKYRLELIATNGNREECKRVNSNVRKSLKYYKDRFILDDDYQMGEPLDAHIYVNGGIVYKTTQTLFTAKEILDMLLNRIEFIYEGRYEGLFVNCITNRVSKYKAMVRYHTDNGIRMFESVRTYTDHVSVFDIKQIKFDENIFE